MLFTPRFSHSTKTFFFFYLLESTKGVGVEIFEIQFLEKFKPFYFLHYAETNLSSSLILMTHINRGDSRIFNSQRVRERVKKFQLETSAEEFSDLHSTTCQTAHDLSLSRLKKLRGRD